MASDPGRSPVSYMLQVNRLPAKGTIVSIDADKEQHEALARAHDLLSVERFSAELLARPWRGDGVQVTGRVQADITQACVVTLEPLAARIDEEVASVFVPEGSRLARIGNESGEIVIEAEGADLPEPFVGGAIDVGALAEEFFALAIDPYPRKQGSALDAPGDEQKEQPAGPLQEAMKKLRGND